MGVPITALMSVEKVAGKPKVGNSHENNNSD